jgi:hypothetical protein
VTWAQYGYISSYPRYFLYTTPVVFGWTLAPVVKLARWKSNPKLVWLFVLTLALLAGQTARLAARRDKWAPFWQLKWLSERPGIRWVPSLRRAANIVDALAAEDDAIDVYAGHDVWIYPAYGVTLKRDVRAIDDVSEIRPNADWVIIDRAFSVIWADPNFRHIRDFRKYLGRGNPTEEDVKLVRALEGDPRFQLVYYDQRTTQAVYRRVRPDSVLRMPRNPGA